MAENKDNKTATLEKDEKSSVELTPKMQEIITSIETMTVLELSKLVTALEDKFGVSAVAGLPMAAAGQVNSDAGSDTAVAEKTSFDVILEAFGDKKIAVIKEVRSITGLGLKEAKGLVDTCPKPVKEGVKKEEAAKIKETLEKAGAQVTIK